MVTVIGISIPLFLKHHTKHLVRSQLTFNKKYGLRWDMTPKQALIAAIDKAETQEKLAELIGTAQQNISYDLKKGRAGHDRVLAIERTTGVPKEQLRPDLYPVD